MRLRYELSPKQKQKQKERSEEFFNINWLCFVFQGHRRNWSNNAKSKPEKNVNVIENAYVTTFVSLSFCLLSTYFATIDRFLSFVHSFSSIFLFFIETLMHITFAHKRTLSNFLLLFSIAKYFVLTSLEIPN